METDDATTQIPILTSTKCAFLYPQLPCCMQNNIKNNEIEKTKGVEAWRLSFVGPTVRPYKSTSQANPLQISRLHFRQLYRGMDCNGQRSSTTFVFVKFLLQKKAVYCAPWAHIAKHEPNISAYSDSVGIGEKERERERAIEREIERER